MVGAGNCTDRTGLIARRGVTVIRTVGNTDRKVGALNSGWLRWQARFQMADITQHLALAALQAH